MSPLSLVDMANRLGFRRGRGGAPGSAGGVPAGGAPLPLGRPPPHRRAGERFLGRSTTARHRGGRHAARRLSDALRHPTRVPCEPVAVMTEIFLRRLAAWVAGIEVWGYADDTPLAVAELSSAPPPLRGADRLPPAAGPRLNIQKTTVIPLGGREPKVVRERPGEAWRAAAFALSGTRLGFRVGPGRLTARGESRQRWSPRGRRCGMWAALARRGACSSSRASTTPASCRGRRQGCWTRSGGSWPGRRWDHSGASRRRSKLRPRAALAKARPLASVARGARAGAEAAPRPRRQGGRSCAWSAGCAARWSPGV